ncbi:hypothetical protein WH47_05643 [Habropoda laboriosa]|uniref:Uncharacterized protein n=1 Tax=Habropoda laboriosa TaxID=597456 RepID=A0A0L7QQH2_9HYME|nr:hypothetical protein WH47_05643 [Habropoda laboriosa]
MLRDTEDGSRKGINQKYTLLCFTVSVKCCFPDKAHNHQIHTLVIAYTAHIKRIYTLNEYDFIYI